MKLKIFTVLFLLFLSGAGKVFSQAPVLKDSTNGDAEKDYQVGDIRGKINLKAVYLPKPPFPREALEAGADGAVKVEVVVDASGNVVSAKALSGHPLLYPTAEETARRTKFRRIETADPNATEKGTITYNFVIQPLGWARIGYDLAIIQKLSTLRPFAVPRIARTFQPDWKEEHEILSKLAEMRRIEMETENASVTDNKPVFVRKTAPNQSGTLQSSVKAEIRLPTPVPPSGERIALAQNLTAALQSRLAADESNLWKFNTGTNIARAFEIARNPNERSNAAQILRQSLEIAPTDIAAESRAALQKLIEIFESGQRTVDTSNEIGKSLTILFNSK